MDKMTICHVTTAHRLHDARILFKECAGLVSEGYEVHLIAPCANNTCVNGVTVHALPNNRTRKYRLLKQRNNAFEKMMHVKADLYHFHDPELISIGLKIKRVFSNAHVVFDVHEFIREQIINKTWLGPLALRQLISRIYKYFERYMLKKYDGIVVSVPELANEYSDLSQTETIRNVPILGMLDSALRNVQTKSDGIVRIIYPGTIGESRSIIQLLHALELLGSRYRLYLIGRWIAGQFRQKCILMHG